MHDKLPSFLSSLQASGTGGCQLCKLILHATQKQKEDGGLERVLGPCSETGSLTIRSTRFDEQIVQIDFKEAGKLRGRLVPPEWCRNSPF